ncbi:MAG TPA: twin-arginine translocase TatA/TatE family subunit [Thermoplasmata archaeon]|nr:twin-arginine translocase TatA/TatE family subunit [Thermoplasmata archaeon]
MAFFDGAIRIFRDIGLTELLIVLIVAGLLLLFGPTKLPEMARAMGRAWGEFRKGRMEVERELRKEMAASETEEVVATRDEVLKAARELSIPTEGRELREVKMAIAQAIDRAEPVRIVAAARAFGLPVEGIGADNLKQKVILRLHV